MGELGMKSWFATFAVLGTLGWAVAAGAQGYPSRPITLVVPFPAGGPSDLIARALSQHLQHTLRQPVVIENHPGANGIVGVGRVARAAPDGYTLVIGHWSTHVVNAVVYPYVYDGLKNFEPISLIASNAYVIVANHAVPATDLKGFVNWLKSRPGQAAAGTAGPGSPQHVGGVLFQKATQTQFKFVPYRGAVPVMQALVARDVDMTLDDPANALPPLREGKIRAFAVTAKNRLPSAPEIPTVDEAGLPGFYFSRWHALWAPANTPQEVVAKLNAALGAALADPQVRARFAGLGQEIFPLEQQTPAALGSYHRAEIEKWWPMLKALGIKAE
jgi:tripartite-type tricarboxylate transporter receptor subunit TctC